MVDRYTVVALLDGVAAPARSLDGDLVNYADYETIQRENDELKAQLLEREKEEADCLFIAHMHGASSRNKEINELKATAEYLQEELAGFIDWFHLENHYETYRMERKTNQNMRHALAEVQAKAVEDAVKSIDGVYDAQGIFDALFSYAQQLRGGDNGNT